MDHQERRSTSMTSGRNSGKGESSRRTTNIPNDHDDTSVQQKLPIYLPIANVNRIMRDAISARGRISDDAKETVQACVTEFIKHVTNVANQKCDHEFRKTITANDIIFAMGALGFDNYVEPLSIYLGKMRETDSNRKPKSGLQNGKRHVSSGQPEPNHDPSSQFHGYAVPSYDGYHMGNVDHEHVGVPDDNGYYMSNGEHEHVGGSPRSDVQCDPSWPFM